MKEGEEFRFQGDLRTKDSFVGELIADFRWASLPIMANLVGGVHMETGVTNGQPLFAGVPLPKVPLSNLIYVPFAPKDGVTLVLPPGWEARTNEKGKVYYIDHNTEKTTWTHPNDPHGIAHLQSAAKTIQLSWRKHQNRRKGNPLDRGVPMVQFHLILLMSACGAKENTTTSSKFHSSAISQTKCWKKRF